MLNHALQTLGLQRVVADIDPDNIASVAVARKLGLTPDDTAPDDGRTPVRYIAVAKRKR